jgi:hypothetical protein
LNRPTDSFYRRRHHQDGHSYIVHSAGPALLQRDDAHGLVFDYRFTPPRKIKSATGRHGAGSATITPLLNPAVAARLWVWPDRPLRIVEFFNAGGYCVIYRVDFATPPQRSAHGFYQTDLYLDLLIATDSKRYAILDEDELEAAFAAGLISALWRARVLDWSAQLVELLDAGQFRAWLTSTCPAIFDIARLRQQRKWIGRTWAVGEPDDWPEGYE